MSKGIVYVLEGVNGTGKTTLSRALASASGGVIIRPFHNLNPDSHWGQTLDEEERGLRLIGASIQTPADDMYVADMLSKMRPPIAICDRSLITGMAYGDFDHPPRSDVKEWARTYWLGLLNKHHHTVLVHLVADYEVCVQRCASEGRHKHRELTEWERLCERYRDEVEAVSGAFDEVYHINTSVMAPHEALNMVLGSQRWARGEDDG